ncbi:MAG: hydrogenase expression/formation protein HypE [Isosphaeraceae bacterium]
MNDSPLHFACPIPPASSNRVLLSHGGGGRMSRRLIREVFHKHFQNNELARDHDGAYLDLGERKLAFSTDAFVVRPPFFPGGDIGSLAVHGTVNDLAACGARARWMSAAFILEEGFPLSDLEQIVASMARAARAAEVEVVTGDTKVVENGKGDGIFITTSGVGVVFADPVPDPRAVRPGDRVLISGPIGVHGMAIMSVREGLAFESELASDSAPLGDMVASVYRWGVRPRCLRDPTRGGVAATLVEIAQASRTGILLEEDAIPVPEMVKGACEILGLDPLLVANEGVMMFVVSPDDESPALQALRAHPLGRQAATIGQVQAEEPGNLLVHTPLGSTFVLDIPAGEELPRIC